MLRVKLPGPAGPVRRISRSLGVVTLLCGLVGGLLFYVAPAGGGDAAAKSVAAKVAAFHGKTETAIFAGGCFWCMQPPFDKTPGVIATTVGYCGGVQRNPTYEQVSRGRTGHVEAVKVVYDPARVGYDALLDVFWRSMDPTDAGGQFADRGRHYRPAIFYLDAVQKKTAEASRKRLGKSGRFKKPIVVEITKATTFWVGEGYHQKYYKKHPARYSAYRRGSGRSGFLARVWSKRPK